MPGKYLTMALICLLTTSCAADSSDANRWDGLLAEAGKPSPGIRRHGNARSIIGNSESMQPSSFGVPGTGQFVNESAMSVIRETAAKGKEVYRVNFSGAPIEHAAQKVLGDILEIDYVIDPRTKGQITLQTSNAVSKEALLEIFEAALAVNGAALVARSGSYTILPSSEVLGSSPEIMSASSKDLGPGIRLQVLQLKYLSAEEMKNVLEPVSRAGSIVRVDRERNYIMIAGNSVELQSMRDMVSIFDVDWMKGMSVALFPLKASRPDDVARELNSIFGVTNANSRVVRFIANDRLHAVLAISARPNTLDKVAGWIRKLDRLAETNEEQLYVYEIQNRPAAELAAVLQSVLKSGSNSGTGSGLAPNLTPVNFTSDGKVAETEQSFPSNDGSNNRAQVPTIVPDIEKNALLISSTPREYKRIERILSQLDVIPTQVFLEAIIAEISLSDDLKFGLNWYFEQHSGGLTLSDLSNGAVTSSFPGFSWTRSGTDMRTTLNAISSLTKVKVISSPNLMVVNNQKATLQVGDQVPVVIQSAANTGASNVAIVNSVELRDTGIILSVTPRINSSGRVMLDIQQEVSNVVPNTTSGIDSPTIQQRKISTRVVVNDGESLALGGLIQERNAHTEKKLPLLGDIPLFGNAFKSKTDALNRTELVIFIRPRVVHDIEEARQVTEEFRKKLNLGSQEVVNSRIKRDLNRLVQ